VPKSFKRLEFKDKDVALLQQNCYLVFNEINHKEIIDGIVVRNVSIPTGSVVKVDHKLGRAPEGWIVIRKRANADVWDTQDANLSNKSIHLYLNSSADVVVDLWIF
jgi:hypothetical protein